MGQQLEPAAGTSILSGGITLDELTGAISGTPVAGEYARWADANTLEARSTAQVLSDIGAAQADHEYAVYLSSLNGAQPQVFTEIPATDGHYVFSVTLKQNAGSGHTRVRFSFRVASGTINDCTGIQEGPSDMNTYVRVLVVSSKLSFKFNLGGAAAWFHIQSTVAISASALTGWTSAAVSDWSGTTPSWVHYATGQQHFVDYLFAASAVATPSVGRTIYGPFAPWVTTHATDSPTVTSDASNNFRVGDLWVEQDTSKLWYCVSNTNGAASWVGLMAASAIKLDDLATPDDNTDLNASSTRHGLLPKLSNVVTEFLTGTGTWATPASGWTTVTKTADESTTADTTVTADSTLLFAVAANTKYRFRVLAFFSTGATPGFKFSILGPSTPTLFKARNQYGNDSNGMNGSVTTTSYYSGVAVGGAGGGGGFALVEGVLHNGANAGNIEFGWAQNTSDAGTTTVLAGSFIEYKVVA